MKSRWMIGMTLALLTFSVSFAAAQGGGRRGQFGGAGGGIQMLRIEEVQKELKMTPEQIAKLDAKQQEVQQALREARQGGGNPQDLSAEEREKRAAKTQEIQTKAVNDILDAKQQKRYHQLELQQQGVAALTRKEVVSELKLTDEQVTKLRKVQTDMNEETRSARQGVNFQNLSDEERQKLTTKTDEIRKSAGEKAVAVLTDDQKKQWKEMQGEPFKFPPPRRRGA